MSSLALSSRLHLAEYWQLGKPRVVALIVFCALAGMLLAPLPAHPTRLLPALAGIALLATAAAAANCLFERDRDAQMRRTSQRPLVRGSLAPAGAAGYALLCLLAGSALLALHGWLLLTLTLATAAAYSIVYTRWLKPASPQNIVIGGAAGAMPPLLGWVAATGHLDPEALSLFLIIYAWTPPHFWALALYRRDDYLRAGLPMLPVTHGPAFTRLSILLYSVLLLAISTMPFGLGLGNWLYLAGAILLGARFLQLAWRLYSHSDDSDARVLFRFSIRYLGWLFALLLAEHWLIIMQVLPYKP
ncbi:heme o synthase [Chitinilyticum piscinae]|uniref:Protoheme IX farnesyltransferase n=1 Tax=Chitinilyticum piscinae TaxID=2866724 RepID=A0A8J7FM70_9NEIS|nr:heme o synthase [Chitinilyticum piscinae]MBE9610497.1 protoheme IX farnesyltransferase [Chitinilyticum piscinae]